MPAKADYWKYFSVQGMLAVCQILGCSKPSVSLGALPKAGEKKRISKYLWLWCILLCDCHLSKTQSRKNSVKAVSSLMVVLCFTSSHPKTESKLNDIKNELDNWSWLYEHHWSCMILMSNDHSWSLIMLIMYEICWSCYDTLLIMHDICWSCYERLLIMHEICWSCHERLLIIHDDQWSLPWKTVDHSWSTLIGVSYRDHYSLRRARSTFKIFLEWFSR